MSLFIGLKFKHTYIFDRELLVIHELETEEHEFNVETWIEELTRSLKAKYEDYLSWSYSLIHTIRRFAYYLKTGKYYSAHTIMPSDILQQLGHEDFYHDASMNLDVLPALIHHDDAEGEYIPEHYTYDSEKEIDYWTGDLVQLWEDLAWTWKETRNFLEEERYMNEQTPKEYKNKEKIKFLYTKITEFLEYVETALRFGGLKLVFW